jgi:hypothetical protein
MGNTAVSKMNKKVDTIPKTLRAIAKRTTTNKADTIVPRTIVSRGPTKSYNKTRKENPQTTTTADIVAVSVAVATPLDGEGERKLIQKTKSRFRHFIFTETSPAISPVGLVHKALNVVPGLFRVGTSYVLYSHDPASYFGSCPHVRGSTGTSIHYHLLLRSNDPDLETTLIKKAADSFVYVENSFYQVPVQCPLTTYSELHQDAVLLEKVGGDIFDTFERVLQRGSLKPLARVNIEPVWEAHKQSQVLAQEQLIAIINAGPYRSVLSQMLGALVEKTGSVSFEQNGWLLVLECGRSVSAYQYPSSISDSEGYLTQPQLPNPAQVTYSTAVTEPEVERSTSYEYMSFPQTVVDDYYSQHTQPMDCEVLTPPMDYAVVIPQPQTAGYEIAPQETQEYDLVEELLKEPDEPTPEEALDAVIRSFAESYEHEHGIQNPRPLQ